MSELVRRYELPAATACVVAIAERLRTDLVVSLDEERLSQVRARVTLRILPVAPRA